MENLWFGTDPGLSKDWDDEFDDIETPITYEFPYSELASQSGVPPVVCPSKSVSPKQAVTVSVDLKDGNILKSRKTYSKVRKNPLFTHYELSQGKKQKDTNAFSESCKAKNSQIELPQKKSHNKSFSVTIEKHSKIGDNPTEKAKTAVTLNNFAEKELVNGVKIKSVHCDELKISSEYSLFGDFDEELSVDQPEESTNSCAEDQSRSCTGTLNTGYQRTRKNLKQQVNSKIIQSGGSMGKKDSAANVTDNGLAPIKNTNDSRSALEMIKERQGSGDLYRSGGEDEILDFQPPPPKKHLTLMDMVKKYSEIQNSDQNKNTSSRRKRPTKKLQNSKTVRATSSKLTIDTNDKSCYNLGNSSSSFALKNADSFKNDKNALGLLFESPQTLGRNRKEISINYNISKGYPVSQLSCEINNDHSAVNSKKSVKRKRGKAPPKIRQTKTRKPKSVPCSEMEWKGVAVASSLKHAQSSVSNLIISKESSIHNSLQSSAQPTFHSSVCNRVFKNARVSQLKTAANQDLLSSNSAISQCSQTAEGNQLLNQNDDTLVSVSLPLSTSNINVKPLNSTRTVLNKTKINLSVQDVFEQSTVESNFQLNPSASVHNIQSKELDTSDSESETPVVNHRTFSLLGADFFCHMVSKMDSISKSCVVQCLEAAEDWIAETPYSRELTVKEFCNNPLVMNVMLEFLNGYPDSEKLHKLDNCTKVFYEFPEDFQNVPLFRMLKDYVDQILLQMVPPNFSPILSLSSRSVLEFAFSNMPFRECAIMSLLFSKPNEVLKLADVAAKLNFVAMLVIFDEFRQREIES